MIGMEGMMRELIGEIKEMKKEMRSEREERRRLG